VQCQVCIDLLGPSQMLSLQYSSESVVFPAADSVTQRRLDGPGSDRRMYAHSKHLRFANLSSRARK
jgi:hypothetical protein